MVSNDPILDSKVVTDELGQLGRPARRWSLTSLAGSPGRPGRLAPAWRAGGLLPGKGTREELRRGRSAQAMMEPPPPTPITAGGLFSINAVLMY